MHRPHLLALFALVLSPASALAQTFVCTAVPDSNPLLSQVWNQRCLPYYINENDSDIFASAERKRLVAQSFAVWSGNNCTDLTFTEVGTTEQSAGFNPARCDNQNIIKAINDRAELNEHFDGANLLAVTLTSFSLETGEIFDADILVNDLNFDFDDVSDQQACQSNPNVYDLRNTLVHEMGHFIGFDHTSSMESTMFASAPPCETKKRDLEQLDIQGVCNVYPSAGPPSTCAPPPNNDYDSGRGDPTPFRDQCNKLSGECESSGSCTCTAPKAPGFSWTFLGLFLGALFFRRSSGR